MFLDGTDLPVTWCVISRHLTVSWAPGLMDSCTATGRGSAAKYLLVVRFPRVELGFDFCVLVFPAFCGVRHLNAFDGVGSHVLAPHVDGAHGQREREHNEASSGIGQAELVLGDPVVELACTICRGQLQVLSVMLDEAIGAGGFHDRLVAVTFHGVVNAALRL